MLTPKLTVVIQHAPWDEQRRAWLIQIRRALPDALVVQDVTRAGVWPTNRVCWVQGLLEAERTGATHVLVLSDDMIPVPNFLCLAHSALAVHPDMPVNFFCMKQGINEALAKGLHWLQINDYFWGASSVLPAVDIPAFLRWEAESIRPEYPHDDGRVCGWILLTGRTVFVTAPSLLQHVGASTSLLGHSNRLKVATALATGEPIDWHTDALRLSGSISRASLQRRLKPHVKI